MFKHNHRSEDIVEHDAHADTRLIKVIVDQRFAVSAIHLGIETNMLRHRITQPQFRAAITGVPVVTGLSRSVPHHPDDSRP